MKIVACVKEILDFALRLRLQAAYELLSATTASISEIALECGFSDCSHFARSFRKQYCETPSKVRNKLAKRDPCCYRIAA